jgi:hypothetical protein
MPRIRWGLAAALVLAAAWAVSGRQGRPHVEPGRDDPPAERASAVSLEERLIRPTRLPFAEETSLADVARWLHETLQAPVVLDRAALERQGLSRDSTVQLELDGVRLKTALRLLLDQVGLTYRLEPEDNLLVVTDAQGANEPLPRILGELEALHRDLHALQNSVDELYDALVPESGPALQMPTIIEEKPEGPEAPSGNTTHRTRPG